MARRVLELRVHGVSNTPPAALLGIAPKPGDPDADRGPKPRLVAGDSTTGFYRPSTSSPTDPVTVEGYSWGALTSGARAVKDVRRALWTLLLPFALANLALHARPDIPPDGKKETWSSQSGITAWLVRVFCLSLTATFVLAATGVGVDLIAWQCVDKSCLSQIPGRWEFLASGWWSEPPHSMIAGLAVPLGVLAVVGFLSWRTYHYEAELPATPPTPSHQPALKNPMQDPTFWCGEGQVRRLAVLHLATGAVVAVLIPLGAVLAMDPPVGARAVVAWATVAAAGAALLLCVAVLGHPYLTHRGGDTPLGRYAAWVIGLAVVAVLGTVAVLLFSDGPAGTPLKDLRPPAGCAVDRSVAGCAEDRSLPGYDWVVAWMGTTQVLLLIAIAGVARAGRRALVPPAIATVLLLLGNAWRANCLPGAVPGPRWLHTWALAAPLIGAAALVTLLLPRRVAQPEAAEHAGMVWGGRGPAVVAGLGWLLGAAYSTGVLYWTTDRLNRGATPNGVSAITPPIPVMWGGLALLVSLLAVAVAAGRALVIFLRLRRQSLAEIAPPGRDLSPHERRRARDVAAFRGLHRLVGEHALRLAGRLAPVIMVLAIAGTSAALSHDRPAPPKPTSWQLVVVKATADIGDSLAGLIPVLVAGLGLLVYRSETVRRTVGIIWDIATFWPRAAHPLGPPSYAERAVPQLETRTTGLMALPEHDPQRPDAIILSGHSQGSVICAAVVLQLPADWRARTWFFSYGCQLTRLYGRVFPAYFGPERLPVITELLVTNPQSTLRWTNFWRETDPLGWPVEAGERQVLVPDPEALHPSGGEVNDPPIRNHSGYHEAPEFVRERDRVVAGPAAGPSGGNRTG